MSKTEKSSNGKVSADARDTAEQETVEEREMTEELPETVGIGDEESTAEANADLTLEEALARLTKV